jgi:hypothetical protein
MPEIGDVVRLETTATDPVGNLADAGAVTVSVTLPDGTAGAAGAVQHPSTGAYYADLAVTQAGRHLVRWVGTGANASAFAEAQVLDVWPTDPRYLFSLDAARNQIGEYATDDDELLRLYVAATTPVIEDITGPLVRTPKTRTFDGGRDCYLIPPGSTVTSVTESGTALPAGDFTVDVDAGIVYAGGQYSPRVFAPGRQNVVVAYTQGATQIPPNVLLAALEEFRFLWQVSQQGTRFGGDDEDTAVYTPSGFAVPRMVVQLCAGNRRAPGFA